jgi:hypothetical protein
VYRKKHRAPIFYFNSNQSNAKRFDFFFSDSLSFSKNYEFGGGNNLVVNYFTFNHNNLSLTFLDDL